MAEVRTHGPNYWGDDTCPKCKERLGDIYFKEWLDSGEGAVLNKSTTCPKCRAKIKVYISTAIHVEVFGDKVGEKE